MEGLSRMREKGVYFVTQPLRAKEFVFAGGKDKSSQDGREKQPGCDHPQWEYNGSNEFLSLFFHRFIVFSGACLLFTAKTFNK